LTLRYGICNIGSKWVDDAHNGIESEILLEIFCGRVVADSRGKLAMGDSDGS
jgi:hypothetical protein